MVIKSSSIKLTGLMQALEVGLYCLGVSLIFWKGNDIFGPVDIFLGPAMVLVLFSVSVLICGLLVFYRPYKLFFEGKKKEAVDLVLYTTVGLFAFFLAILISAVGFY